MKNFKIVTDSCADLSIDFVEKEHIDYVSLTCSYDENEYIDDFGRSISFEKFYTDMRKGSIPKTSQPNSEAYYKKFKEVALQGNDIIYICVSTGLSGSFNSANIAKNMICDEFKDIRIDIIDVLTASLGQGSMVIKALEMQKEGHSFDEIVEYIENIKHKLNTYITVNDLIYLKRGGRISTAAATLGIVLHIKPVITINHEGRVIPVIKVRGRKKAIDKIVEIVCERVENPQDNLLCISHGDCIEEAENLKNKVFEQVKFKDVIISNIGPVVGSYGGPGALAIFFIGKERQHHIIEEL